MTRLNVGDPVGVGCIVDSCLNCAACKRGEEQMCSGGGMTGTYSGKPIHGRADTVPAGSRTLGGYTDKFVIDERFAIRIPAGFPLELAGPIMCGEGRSVSLGATPIACPRPSTRPCLRLQPA